MERMETGTSENAVTQVLRTSSHPIALIFLVTFRTLAVIVYLLNGYFSNGFILSFVLITLLLSFDFWTIKNVSGRLLVGLRWWNEIKDDGSNVWVFESKPVRPPPTLVETDLDRTDNRMELIRGCFGGLYIYLNYFGLFLP